MLSKLSVFVATALAASVLATAINHRDVTVAVCSTDIRCCQGETKADFNIRLVFADLGVNVPDGARVLTKCPKRVTNTCPPLCCNVVSNDDAYAYNCKRVTLPPK